MSSNFVRLPGECSTCRMQTQVECISRSLLIMVSLAMTESSSLCCVSVHQRVKGDCDVAEPGKCRKRSRQRAPNLIVSGWVGKRNKPQPILQLLCAYHLAPTRNWHEKHYQHVFMPCDEDYVQWSDSMKVKHVGRGFSVWAGKKWSFYSFPSSYAGNPPARTDLRF